MKKNIFILKALAVASAALMFCSCEDFLVRDHPTEISDDDFWSTSAECDAALSTCQYWYTGVRAGSSPRLAMLHFECATDNGHWSGNFQGEIGSMANGSLTTTTGGWIRDVWSNYYVFLRRCNRFLENVHRAYFVEEYERERMIAEARTWRVWYHAQLLMLYGWNDGIPIQDKSLNGDEIYKSRNTVEEVLDFINTEIDDLVSIDDDRIYPFLWDKDRRSRMCKAYALTIQMDVNLQFHNYEKAMAAAKQIIDSGVFELYYNTNSSDTDPGKSYRDIFRYAGQDNKERIMYVANGCYQAWFRDAPGSLGGQGAASVLRSLVDTYETIDGVPLKDLSEEERTNYEHTPLYKPRDPRLYETVFLPGDNTSLKKYTYEPFNENSADYIGKSAAPRSGYWVKKYIDENDRSKRRGTLPFVLYRYAEVLLDYVECLVETGDWQNPDVEKYINEVRNRAGMPDMDKTVYNTQEKVRELYRRERRVELAFEGKRYFDIRRWGIGNETMNGLAEGAWNPNEQAFVAVENRECTFPKYNSWPIPITEETANPNIEQPTGW